MVDQRLSRRSLIVAASLGAAATMAPTPALAKGPGKPIIRGSLDFIEAMTTASEGGPTLPRSYADELGLFSTAFVYDSALATCAALSAGRPALAKRIGDGLLFAQDNDPDHADGRLRQGYNVSPYVFYDGNPNPWGLRREDGKANVGWQFGFLGTAVGDMAWPAISLIHLHDHTGDPRYLRGAVRIAEWILANALNPGSLGGFSFGVDGANNRVPNVSTEHNVDCIAMFSMLDRVRPDARWVEGRERAQALVDRMWNPTYGYYYTGSNDGDTINKDLIPLDPQTWGWLAMRSERASAALDWAADALAVHDTPDGLNSLLPEGVDVRGVTFTTASLETTASYNDIPAAPQAVWLEGTAQLACAFNDRSRPRDKARAVHLLREVEEARLELGHGQRISGTPVTGGVVAASSVLDTGFNWAYFQVQHVGATAWAVMAERRANPMQFRGL